jgi:hypothetical protein
METPKQVISLNSDILADIPIELLEERLQIEELDVRSAAWTCSCDSDAPPPTTCPSVCTSDCSWN